MESMSPISVLTGIAILIPLIVLFVRERSRRKLLYKAGSFFLRCFNFFRGKKIFSVKYGGGFNLHFACTYKELKGILPDHLEPLKMTIMRDDKNEQSSYLISIYMADTQLGKEQKRSRGIADAFRDAITNPIGRADVFTYATDAENEMSLFFLSALMEVPFTGVAKKIFSTVMTFFALDPIDYSVAYPHQEADNLTIDGTGFAIKCKGAEISLDTQVGTPISTKGRFHIDFVNANSQIYRGPNGTRNVNFFNQDFVDADVACWDTKHVSKKNTEAIHPLCRELVAVEYYSGRNGRDIVWYFENA